MGVFVLDCRVILFGLIREFIIKVWVVVHADQRNHDCQFAGLRPKDRIRCPELDGIQASALSQGAIVVSQSPLAESTSGGPARAMSRSQIVLMVAALIASVIAFQLNATMLIPAIHTIDEDFGRGAFAATSTYFSPAGAVSSVVLIRWSDYVGRKRVMIVMCVGTVLYIVGTALGILVVGRILQGGSVITSGLAFLITREHLSGPAFGTCCGLVTVSTPVTWSRLRRFTSHREREPDNISAAHSARKAEVASRSKSSVLPRK